MPALYDSGANLIPGLILLEQFVIDHNFEYVRFDDSIHPPGVNMANGARLSIAGQVPQVDVKIESKVFSFFSVPVFKSLNHPVIFGFSSSTKHGIFYDIDGQSKKVFLVLKKRGGGTQLGVLEEGKIEGLLPEGGGPSIPPSPIEVGKIDGLHRKEGRAPSIPPPSMPLKLSTGLAPPTKDKLEVACIKGPNEQNERFFFVPPQEHIDCFEDLTCPKVPSVVKMREGGDIEIGSNKQVDFLAQGTTGSPYKIKKNSSSPPGVTVQPEMQKTDKVFFEEKIGDNIEFKSNMTSPPEKPKTVTNVVPPKVRACDAISSSGNMSETPPPVKNVELFRDSNTYNVVGISSKDNVNVVGEGGPGAPFEQIVEVENFEVPSYEQVRHILADKGAKPRQQVGGKTVKPVLGKRLVTHYARAPGASELVLKLPAFEIGAHCKEIRIFHVVDPDLRVRKGSKVEFEADLDLTEEVIAPIGPYDLLNHGQMIKVPVINKSDCAQQVPEMMLTGYLQHKFDTVLKLPTAATVNIEDTRAKSTKFSKKNRRKNQREALRKCRTFLNNQKKAQGDLPPGHGVGEPAGGCAGKIPAPQKVDIPRTMSHPADRGVPHSCVLQGGGEGEIDPLHISCSVLNSLEEENLINHKEVQGAAPPGHGVGESAGGCAGEIPAPQKTDIPRTMLNHPADRGVPHSGPLPGGEKFNSLNEEKLKEKLDWLFAELDIDKNLFLQGKPRLLRQLKALIVEYQDIFLHPEGPQVGDTDIMEVNLTPKPGSRPCRAQVRDLNPKLIKDLQATIDDWLRDGVIEPSSSEWASALVPVKKKDGTVRWAVDFRMVNTMLEGDSFPLPNINALLDRLAGKVVYSSLDCSNAYFTLRINQDSRKYTAFVSPLGLFQFQKLPFGLKQAPSIYSRFVAFAMQKIHRPDLANYLDDTLLGSLDGEEHLARLREVFQAHREAGLLLKPSKTFLFQTEVKFLGHILSEKGISMDIEYCENLASWELPNTGKELASFLGAAGYYGSFLPGYATRAASLHAVKNQTHIEWTPALEDDFKWIRDSFLSPKIRAAPDWETTSSSPFILTTDWSKEGMGYTLSQVQCGTEKLISAGGRKCSPFEANYASYKGEMAALVAGVRKFDKFLSYAPFVVRTDNSVLKYLVTIKNPDGILFRWLQELQHYCFRVEHIPGVQNCLADGISRHPEVHTDPLDPEMLQDEKEFAEISGLQDIYREDSEKVAEHLQHLKEAQQADPLLQIVTGWLNSPTPPTKHEVVGFELHSYHAQLASLCLDQPSGLLIRQHTSFTGDQVKQIVLPTNSVSKIWPLFHKTASSPHPGLQATLERIRRHFYNPTLHHTVQALHQRCIDCKLRASRTDLKQGTFSRESPSYPNALWSVDLMGPFDEYEEQKYVLSILDCFSRYTVLLPIPNKSTKLVATKLWEVITMLGLPAAIKHDLGGEFESSFMATMKEIWSIESRKSIPYFHSANPVERVHKEVNAMMKMLLPAEAINWPDYLPAIRIAINSKVNTNTGYTPNMLMFGRESLHPIQLHLPQLPPVASPAEHLLHLRARVETVMARMQQVQHAYFKKMSNVYRPFKDEFKPGSKVYFVSTYGDRQSKAAKLCYSWSGPAEVQEVTGPYLKLQMERADGSLKYMHLHAGVCRLAQPQDEPKDDLAIQLEPEEMDEYTLPPIPLPTPTDIYGEGQDDDDEGGLLYHTVGGTVSDQGREPPPEPPHEEPEVLPVPEIPHNPPEAAPPPPDAAAAAEIPPEPLYDEVRRSGRATRPPTRLQDYEVEFSCLLQPATYHHFLQDMITT